MEIFKVFILKRLIDKFDSQEFSYKQMRLYLSKSHKIPNIFINDMIGCLIKSKEVLKTKPSHYKLKEGLELYINNYLEKSHLDTNKILLRS